MIRLDRILVRANRKLTWSHRLLIVVLAASVLAGGAAGYAASTPNLDAVLLNNAPCTVTLSGQPFDGNCSGGFVETTATPAPTPTATAAPTPTPTPTPAPTPTPVSGLTPLYASTSFWNQPISSGPALDPNSAAMVQAALAGYAGSANFTNTLGWGRSLVYAHNSDPLYNIGCTLYDCGTAVSFHIPLGAHPETASDGHLVVVNLDTWQELDMWIASFKGSTWTGGSRYLTDAHGWGANCPQGQHCGGAVAAGFAAFGGVIRPEEIQQGHIDHALFLAIQLTRSGYIACPATNTDGQTAGTSAIPEGARIQLDPAFNVDAQPWPQWEKVVAHAMQNYGVYIGDTGGSMALMAQGNQNGGLAWSSVGVPDGPSLGNLPWGRFRVLQFQGC